MILVDAECVKITVLHYVGPLGHTDSKDYGNYLETTA